MLKRHAALIPVVVMVTSCMLLTGCDSDDPVAVHTPAEDYVEIPLLRPSWTLPSQPIHGRSGTTADSIFDSTDRAETIRWFRPKDKVPRSNLDPDLEGEARHAAQTVMELYLATDRQWIWSAENWGGIMCGAGASARNLSRARYVELWVNDGQVEPLMRAGRIHIDFGEIDEDGYWPGGEVGTEQNEDTNGNGVWEMTGDYYEDTGLGGMADREWSAVYDDATGTFPHINSTRGNRLWDREDTNCNGFFTTHNQYFTLAIDLQGTPAEVDVLRDYDDVEELVNTRQAWRKYRIPLDDALVVSPIGAPDLARIDHVRLWFEDDERTSDRVRLQLSELRFSW